MIDFISNYRIKNQLGKGFDVGGLVGVYSR